MTGEDVAARVHAYAWTDRKPGLERTRALLAALGNPEKALKFVHITGSNGKGSTAAMLASVLTAAGYRTGLFTSPHLYRFNERFQVNGAPIPGAALDRLAERVLAAADTLPEHPTEFELMTAIGFLWFAEAGCDLVVVEVGLGGRLDSTNVIPAPEAAVITNIGLEHTALLGDTLQKIAAEKAGIVKKSIPVLIGEADERYDGVIEQAAAANKSKVIYAEREFRCESCTERGDRQSFSLRRTRDDRTFDVELDLRGIYQSRNVVTASAAIDFLHEETPLTISRRAYLEGMRDAAAHTSLHGRWQKIGDAPLTVCDTGHNAHGIAYVARQLKATPCKRLFCVMGFVRDKDLAHILPLLPHEAHYIFTQAHSDRAMTAGELTAKAAIYGLRGEAVADVPAAVARARELAGAEDMIFIGGSTYVVGEAL